MGKGFYLWFQDIIASIAKDATDNKVKSNAVFQKIKESIIKCEFNSEVKEYLYQKIILKQLPHLSIFGKYLLDPALLPVEKTKNCVSIPIAEDIANLDINSTEFGLKYAGLSYLLEHGYAMNNIKSEHLDLMGRQLYGLIDQGMSYLWANRYFMNSAIIHKTLSPEVNPTDVPLAADQDEDFLS